MGVEERAWVNKGKPTELMWAEDEPLEDERIPQPEHLEDEGKPVYGSRGCSLERREPPTRALGSQGWSKVEKRKVERKALWNIPTQDVGWRTGKSDMTQHRPTSTRSLGERYEIWRFSIWWRTSRIQLQCQGAAHSIPIHSFSWPCSAAYKWHAGGNGRPVPSWGSRLHPRDVHVSLKGQATPYLSSALARPKFTIEEAVLDKSTGIQDVTGNLDNRPFPPFLQIVRPYRSWATSPGYQA
jgi:hypothetical protein